MSRVTLTLNPPSAPVPANWKWQRLDAVATELRERAGDRHQLPVLSVTKYRGIVRAEDYFKKAVHGRDTANYKVVRRGQFAYATIHLDEGSIGLLAEETAGIVSPMYTVFQPGSGIDGKYLLSLLKAPEALRVYRRLAEGSVNRRASIGFDALGKLHLLLPPRAEQRKIADILSSIDGVIDKTEGVIKQLQLAKSAIARELLMCGLPGKHTRFKHANIGDIPAPWKVVALGDVANVFNGRAAGRGGSWLRVFKTKHVYDGMLRLDQPEFARDDSAEKVPRNTYLQSGDIVTPNMAHGTIGRVAYVPTVEDSWATDGQVMVLRTFNSQELDHRFLFEFISSEQGRRRLLECEKGSVFDEKRGQTHIYPTDIKQIPIAIPDIDEQRKIASVLASFDAPLAQNAACIARLKDVKNELTQQLLTGELRVTLKSDAA